MHQNQNKKQTNKFRAWKKKKFFIGMWPFWELCGKSQLPACIHAKLKLDPTGERIKEGNKKEKQALNHQVVHSVWAAGSWRDDLVLFTEALAFWRDTLPVSESTYTQAEPLRCRHTHTQPWLHEPLQVLIIFMRFIMTDFSCVHAR